MMPLIVLLFTFFTLFIIGRFYSKLSINIAGRFAFSLMFVFTGVSHFSFAKGMVMSMPDIIPFKLMFVYLTGIIEIFLAIFFLVNRYKQLIARVIIVFLIVVLPANIWAAINHVDIPSATYNGPGLAYLWFRVPLQILFIIWVYNFGIKPMMQLNLKDKKARPTTVVCE